MPTNNLAPKTKNKLGYASSISPNVAERFGAAVSPYLQGAQELFPPTNPYGQAMSNFLLGQAPQAAQQMAEGYPNVLFDTRNLLGGNQIVKPAALDMLSALPVATALKGAGLAKGGVAATFAGARAKTANKEALAVAERMKALGAPDEEIYKATGWFFGSADGKPRFEIDDSGAQLTDAAKAVFTPDTLQLGRGKYQFDASAPDLMPHPELEAAYPFYKNIGVKSTGSLGGGSYLQSPSSLASDGQSRQINISQSGADARSTALHELQHAIQQREKFARGGSPEGLPKALQNDAKSLRTQARQLLDQGNRPEALALEKQARQLDSQIVWGNHAPQELYRRLAGESEARLTQSRMDMTGAERAASYPPGMFDVPVGDQIVRYDDGPALAITWHGTSHKFDPTELNDLGEFNAAKIGTGEGEQAYSYGHYTGEAKKVGGQYQASAASSMYDTSSGVIRSSDLVDEIFKQSGNVPKQLKSAYRTKANEVVRDLIMGKPASEIAGKIRSSKYGPTYGALADAVDRLAPKAAQGYLYKVDIPDEHIAKMLDWDKPLSEQSANVQKALANTRNKHLRAVVDYAASPYSMPELEGEVKTMGEAIKLLGMNQSPAKASQILAKQGIPGVRYLDAGSRVAGGGTSNFVVFPGNEHMMTILERNGQAMSPESQAIARYREVKGPKSVVRMEAALRTAGVPLPKNEPVAYIQSLVDRAHKRH